MNDIVNIPLNQLAQFDGNVRKTQDKGFIGKLAANIKEHGLHQNLIVTKRGKKYAVVAGSQRLTAMLLLAKKGEIRASFPVPCKISDGAIDPSEISLAENVMREDMHPADEFEAFRDLIDKGVPLADIAARFGVSETVVTQRLKLARVSPAVLNAYRESKLSLEQVIVSASPHDHAAQENVLGSLGQYNCDPPSIREALTENEIAAGDRRVKFVTLKAYEKAGGKTRRDLFSEGADSVFVMGAALLEKLVSEKLERIQKSLAKEGWKWLEARQDFGYDQKAQFQRLRAEPPALSPKQAAKVEKLEQELERLNDQWNEDDDSDKPPRLVKIEKQLIEIEVARGKPVWTLEQLAMAGTVVTIGDDGKARIERGLVRPEDMQKKAKPGKAAAAGGAETEEQMSPALSSGLIEDLTAQRSAALSAELLQRPDIALAAVVHAVASCVFPMSGGNALKAWVTPQSFHKVEGSKALAAVDAAREKWAAQIPADTGELWAWCLAQDKAVLLDLLAFCAAVSIDAVQRKVNKPEAARFRHADNLASALGLDMKAWYMPDAARYYSRISKPQILAALKEARRQPPAPAWENLKKSELAQEAERQMAGTGWMPELLRPAA